MNTTQLQSTTNDTLVLESTVRRVLVEKRAGFDLEAQSLKKDFRNYENPSVLCFLYTCFF